VHTVRRVSDPRVPQIIQIIQGDGLAWMRDHCADAATSVITSLPDISELPERNFASWRRWFIDAARAVIRWLPSKGHAIFYQSDVRHDGEWIDKSYLVMQAAETEAAALVWHKIVCRRPAGSRTWGRASYSHMLCFTRGAVRGPRAAGIDVLPSAGAMSWTRAMGAVACEVACQHLRDETETRIVVDPFCGRGSALVTALHMGFDVIGIELSAKRCRAARAALAHTPISNDDPFARGVQHFDSGGYFEAHEAWEELWRAATDEVERTWLQGMIQVAAAMHKLIVVEEADAALRLLTKALAKLSTSPSHMRGVDLESFRQALADGARALSAGRLEAWEVPKLGARVR
jgi:predicted metal-dependent hydrolase